MVDGAAALPADLAAKAGVYVVPLSLSVDGRPVTDPAAPVEDVLGAPRWATSGPSPGAFAEAVSAADRGDGVVVVTVAREVSATHAAATVAADSFPAGRVRVVDSRTAAGAQSLVCLAAARRAAAGGDVAAVAAAAQSAAALARLVATVPDLSRLARSGRVPAVAVRAGQALGVQPLFEFRLGRVRPLRPARRPEHARRRMVAALERASAGSEAVEVAALHASDPAAAQALLADVCARVGAARGFVSAFSPVMIAHTGPGLLGLAWVSSGPPRPRPRGGAPSA